MKLKFLIKNLRRAARRLWVAMLASSGCLWVAKRQLLRSGVVISLMFHRVLGDRQYAVTHSLSGIVIRENTFRELITHLVGRYEAVDLQHVKPGQASNRIRVAITFDDGWSDTYSVAFPILRAFAVPVTVFVCPGLINMKSAFWPEQVAASIRAVRPLIEDSEIEGVIENLKKQTPETRAQHLGQLSAQVRERGIMIGPSTVDKTLSWSAITEMDREGVSFGSHTQTHEILTEIPLDTVRKELRQSKTALEAVLHHPCDSFAYPNGNWSAETRRVLAQEGFTLAVTTDCGAWSPTCDRLAIPRINISEDDVVGLNRQFSAIMFEYTAFWKSWRATKERERVVFRASQQPSPIRL